jgi:transposase
MGRSRGGLTTKVHALVDARGLPLELILTPGQAADCPAAAHLLGRLRAGTILLADKAYDADWLRDEIAQAARDARERRKQELRDRVKMDEIGMSMHRRKAGTV